MIIGASIIPGNIMQAGMHITAIHSCIIPNIICKQSSITSIVSIVPIMERPRSVAYSDRIISGIECVKFVAISFISNHKSDMAEWREDTGCVLFETSIIAGMKRTLPSLVVDIWEESMRDGERSCEAERERPRKGILDSSLG